MAAHIQDNSDNSSRNGGPGKDLSGRDRLASNVLFNWGAHFVFVIAGFIMPRMIDRRLGQDLLGIWDFVWSLVVYTEFLAVGVSTSVDRYVSRLRSLENWEELNRVVSSALVLLTVSFCAGLALTAGFVKATPYLLQIHDETLVSQTQSVILILGVACSLQLPMFAFTGVITGSGRFDIASTIRGGSRALEVGAMVLALVRGHGLIGLAVVLLGFQCLRMLASVIGAKCVCPQLRLSLLRCSLATLTRLLTFGGKSFLYMLSRMGMYQFNAILVAHFLGPAMLAVFSRQKVLIQHSEILLIHYARTLVPVTSAIHARNDREGIRDLLIRASLYSFYIALPLVIILAIMGGPLVRLWMGTAYESPFVLGTLAIGHLLILSQRGTLSVVMALNRHGLAAIAMLVSLITSALVGWFLLAFTEMGLMGAAIALALPVTLFAGLGTMLIGCHITGMRVSEYLRRTLPGPAKLMVPFAIWLIVARWVCGENTSAALIGGLMPGTIMLLGIYWHFVLPRSLKTRITELFVGRVKKKPHSNVLGESNAGNPS